MSSNKEVVINDVRWPAVAIAGAAAGVNLGGSGSNTPLTILNGATDATAGTPVELSGSQFALEVSGPSSGTWSAVAAVYFKNVNAVGVSDMYIKFSINQTSYHDSKGFVPGPYAYAYAVLESITGTIPSPGVTVTISKG